jgi:hypothetical protein
LKKWHIKTKAQSVGDAIKESGPCRTHTFDLKQELHSSPLNSLAQENKWKFMTDDDIPTNKRLYFIFWYDTTNNLVIGPSLPNVTYTWKFVTEML